VLVVLLLHGALTVLTGVLAPRMGPRVFLVAALAPLSGVGLILAAAPSVLAGGQWTAVVPWVPGLDLSLALRLDALALLMLVLVSGVGTLIFLFCAFYAARDATLLRFVTTLTAFAGAMVGLVLADDVIVLYVFWELTTITSYLLIGLDDHDRESRRAALQSLLVTTFGGLAMLVGLIMLAQAAGTTRLSAMLDSPPSGGYVPAALLLVLLGAVSKSAQVPFHPWLPAAMAAPTPVSAYLHAAAMVKAGVYLVARLAPAFAEVQWWRPLLVTIGLATMLLGGWRALRQHDLKRLLAFSTVSQLGFLTAVAAWGTAESAVAVATLLLAHGFAKAALFLSVGAVDHEVHTRDLRQLSGLGRRMPVLAAAAAVAALSMGGVPLTLGFIAKEEVYAAFLDASEPFAFLALGGLVAGSVLTLAYALRFLWGAFADKRLAPTDPDARPAGQPPVGEGAHAPQLGLTGPVLVLSFGSLLLGLAPQLADPLAAALAASYPGAEPSAGLALWHGATVELALSGLTLALGVALAFGRRPFAAVQHRFGSLLPRPLDADRGYDATVEGLERAADSVTGRTQSGSLPVYLGVISLSAVLLPGTALLWRGVDLSGTVLVDLPAQIGVGALIACAAVAAARVTARLSAVLLLGAVGYGVALLFVLQGAPDLALTQFLVETLTLVIFLLVLRLLPQRFTSTAPRRTQLMRVAIAGTVGVFVTVFTLAATAARTRPSVAEELLARSGPEAGGKNVVNVILVDFRGLDTLGEVTVVLVAALGIFSLVLSLRRSRARTEADGAAGHRTVRRSEDDVARREVRAP
jgi:multicomponent Na+:H+ antiporter subunit A